MFPVLTLIVVSPRICRLSKKLKNFYQRSFKRRRLPPKEVAFLMLLSSKIERSYVLSNFIRFDLPTVREMEKNFMI